uniref:Uncharacterized protein n=1 Tax=Anopheles culicifacies TaxID=139723 RepID=A0A182LTB2_9DIPT
MTRHDHRFTALAGFHLAAWRRAQKDPGTERLPPESTIITIIIIIGTVIISVRMRFRMLRLAFSYHASDPFPPIWRLSARKSKANAVGITPPKIKSPKQFNPSQLVKLTSWMG